MNYVKLALNHSQKRMRIHILIMDIIEVVREVVVTTIMVVIGMKDIGTTKMDVTRCEMFIRDLINTMM